MPYMDRFTPDKPIDDLSADIALLRRAIDEIDEIIMGLINRRLLLAAQIGALKKQSGIQVADSIREEEIMRRLGKKNEGPLNEEGLRTIFSVIIAEGRHVQQTG